jgi:hypothetical protein
VRESCVCGAVQHSAVQCNIVQCSKERCSKVQCSEMDKVGWYRAMGCSVGSL